MYRFNGSTLEVLLVNPGGPFWAEKDLGSWSIPKGEYDDIEPHLEAATREFKEETGFEPTGPFVDLGYVKQAGGKTVSAWAFKGNCNPCPLPAISAAWNGHRVRDVRSSFPRSTCSMVH